jgi:general secretion pathway protein L
MAETIIARVFEQKDDFYKFEWSALSENATIAQGNVHELAQAASNATVILLLPATEVLLIELNLPIKSNRQLKKALPYALEDYLANDVELYHWVWSKQADDKVAVAAIEHARLTTWIQQISEAGIKLQGLYAEPLFLPIQENSISILLERRRASVRFSQWLGGGIDQDYLTLFVEKALHEKNLPKQIELWSTEPCVNLGWSKDLTVNCATIPSALTLLQPGKKNELNLLTGVYSPQTPGTQDWKAWIPAASLMLIAVFIQYSIALTAFWDSQKQLADLETSNQQLFKKTFPQVKRIVNLKAQAEQELIALRKNQSHKGGVYLRLLYQSGEILSQDDALQIQAIDFANDVLNLHLAGTSVAQIENFKQLMEQNQNVKVKIQSTESSNTGLSAHLDISEQSL